VKGQQRRSADENGLPSIPEEEPLSQAGPLESHVKKYGRAHNVKLVRRSTKTILNDVK
jgi:hypothetical protein